MADNEKVRLARIELAKRELAKRQSQSQQPESPGILQTMSDAADRITGTIPPVAGLMAPTLGMAQYAGQKMNEASGQLGEAVTERVATEFPNAPTAIPVGLGAVASIASNPMTYVNPEAGINTKLKPFSGKPGIAARIKEMRTGVDAASFEQLRRDPGAFFSTADRGEVGSTIGKIKQKEGINLGVRHGDITSLTPENLKLARSQNVVGREASSSIAEKLKSAVEANPEGLSDTVIRQSGITPDEVSKAIDLSNNRLSKLTQGTPAFQAESAVKSNLQKVLEVVSPELKQANKDFSRVALRDEFMEPFPVNQSGTFSKVSPFVTTPVGSAIGAVVGGPPGAIVGAAIAQGVRSPFVAGLGTATRGLIDKALDPAVSYTANRVAARGGLIGSVTDNDRRNRISQYIDMIRR